MKKKKISFNKKYERVMKIFLMIGVFSGAIVFLNLKPEAAMVGYAIGIVIFAAIMGVVKLYKHH